MSKKKTLQDRTDVDLSVIRPGTPLIVEWDDIGFEVVLATSKVRKKKDWDIRVLTARGQDWVEPEQLIAAIDDGDLNIFDFYNSQDAVVAANAARGVVKLAESFLTSLQDAAEDA